MVICSGMSKENRQKLHRHYHRHDLRDEQWAQLRPFLPLQHTGRPGRPDHDHRRMLNGKLWIAKTGAPWRDLPERYGSWQSVASRFYRWRWAGIHYTEPVTEEV
jgi:transposase